MAISQTVWLLLADARRGRLLRCGLTAQGRCHVEECDGVENTWPGHEHGRSSPLWKNATTTFGIEHNVEEDVRRFAREAGSWLENKMAELGIDKVHVLASGRFLGILRRIWPARLARRTVERNADLIHLRIGALAKHPVVRQIVVCSCTEDGSHHPQ